MNYSPEIPREMKRLKTVTVSQHVKQEKQNKLIQLLKHFLFKCTYIEFAFVLSTIDCHWTSPQLYTLS